MASRIIGLIAALLIFLGVVAVFDGKDRLPVPQSEIARSTRAPEVRLAGLEAWDAAPLLMPTTLPAGWELTHVGILPASETKEGCDQVELDYEDPTDPEVGFLYLYEFPQSCAKPLTSSTAFNAGPYRGFSRTSDEEGSIVQLTVDTTTVQATSDLTLAELADVLAELVPLELGA